MHRHRVSTWNAKTTSRISRPRAKTIKIILAKAPNGKDLGLDWRPLYLVDVLSAATARANPLEVTAANLWPDGIIGDEHLPDDRGWSESLRFGPSPPPRISHQPALGESRVFLLSCEFFLTEPARR
jgi:hypothetical protein